MLIKGKAKCSIDGIFEWELQYLGKEKSCFSGVPINIKSYNDKTNTIVANCPICGKSIIVKYDFSKKEIIGDENG